MERIVSIVMSLAVWGMVVYGNVQEGNVVAGEQIFKTRCTACHTIGKGKLIGPDLAGILDRRDQEWVAQFIRNSQELIESGDEQAKAIFEEFKVPMPPHDFSDQEMKDLLAFLAQHPTASPAKVTTTPETSVAVVESAENQAWRTTLKSTSFHIAFWVVTTVAVLAYFALAFVIAGYSKEG